MAALSLFSFSEKATADLDVRRVLARPGEVVAVLPPDPGLRRLRIQIDAPPFSGVSSIISWSPADRPLAVRLQNESGNRALSSISGPSPMAVGAQSDTGGRLWLYIEDASGGRDSISVTAQVNWVQARPVPVQPEPSAVRTETSAPAPSATPVEPAVPSQPCRIVEINWREGGLFPRSRAGAEGFTLRFSTPVNEEMLKNAISVEVAVPGSQPGLVRYEQAQVKIVVTEQRRVSLMLPTTLSLPAETPVRITIDGDRLLSRNGSFADLEGSGAKLPSGEGRPGGSFRSQFRLGD